MKTSFWHTLCLTMLEIDFQLKLKAMKTRLLIIAGLLLMAFKSEARHANAVFKTNNGAHMIVFLDGNRINQRPSEVVKLNKIYPGKHNVRIKVIGKRFNREIKRRIHLRRGHRSKFMVNSYGRRANLEIVKVNEKPINNYGRQKPYASNHDLLQMDRFMHSLNLRRFDNDKVYFTKRVLSKKSLYAEDLLEILNSITFESNKVEIADFAYNSVIDKRNFHIVYDAFRFQSSIRQLEKSNYDDTWF